MSGAVARGMTWGALQRYGARYATRVILHSHPPVEATSKGPVDSTKLGFAQGPSLLSLERKRLGGHEDEVHTAWVCKGPPLRSGRSSWPNPPGSGGFGIAGMAARHAKGTTSHGTLATGGTSSDG